MTFSPIFPNDNPEHDRRAALASVYAFLIEKGRQRKERLARLAVEQAGKETANNNLPEQSVVEEQPCPKA